MPKLGYGPIGSVVKETLVEWLNRILFRVLFFFVLVYVSRIVSLASLFVCLFKGLFIYYVRQFLAFPDPPPPPK